MTASGASMGASRIALLPIAEATFDLLELDGQDLRREPWETRRATLASLLHKVEDGSPVIGAYDSADGETLFNRACRLGLEGIIAKRRDKPYMV